MAIKGSLKEASLADVCQLLAMGRKSGCLSVTDRSRFGQVYFENGRITFARIVNRRDRIGDLLVHDGVITQRQLRDVLQRQSEQPHRRLGQLLLEEGHIQQEQLEAVVAQQIEEAVYHLFTWSSGSFFFEVGQEPEDIEHLVSINPENLLLEGARRVDEWSVVEKKIPSLDLIFELDRESLFESDVELTPNQKHLLPLLDGANSVQDIADQSGLVEFDVGKALYGLIQAGFLHHVGKRTPGERGGVRDSEVAEHRNLGVAFARAGMLEDAAREFRRALELRPEDSDARHHMAVLALRQGRAREGVERTKLLLEGRGPTPAGLVNLAYGLHGMGRPSDALLALEEAENLIGSGGQGSAAPTSHSTGDAGASGATLRVPLLRGAIHAERGEYDLARQQLEQYRERLGERTPEAPFFHIAALLAGRLGDLEAAAGIAESGVSEYPTSAPLLATAGAIAERRGRFPDAEDLLRRALQEDPDLMQVHRNLGDLAYRRGDHDEALEHFEKLVESLPDLGDEVHARLGNIHYKRHEHDRALEYWRRALELNPSNQVVRNNLDVVANAAG